MTDNCRASRHRGDPLETEQTEEQPTLDGLRREIEELRASRKRLALAADAERRGIERALHEGVQQDLVGLAANLEVAAGSVDSDPAAAKALLDELQREARRALTEMQELATRVFPPLLEAGGLVAELRAAASRAGVQAQIDVDVDVLSTGDHRRRLFLRPGRVRARAGRQPGHGERSGRGKRARVRDRRGRGPGMERRAPHDRVEALGGQVTITARSDRTTVAGSLPISR